MALDGEAAYGGMRLVVRYATAMVGPDDASDVVADAMLRVFGTGDVAVVDDVRAYLYRRCITVLFISSGRGRVVVPRRG